MPHTEARYSDGETIALASDEYFVVGDDPDISDDSRMEGPTRQGAVVGVVDLIYWPLTKLRILR